MSKPVRLLNSTNHSKHYGDIYRFMLLGEQDPPRSVTYLSEEQRLLRAKLQLEETLELLSALNVGLVLKEPAEKGAHLTFDDLDYCVYPEQMDLIEVIDACVDIQVISTGTMVSMGIPDYHVVEGVDANNLTKVEDGVIRDEFGKILKPPGYQPVDILGLITKDADKETKEALRTLIIDTEG